MKSKKNQNIFFPEKALTIPVKAFFVLSRFPHQYILFSFPLKILRDNPDTII